MTDAVQRTRLSIMFGVGSLYKRSSGPFLTTLQTAQELRRRGHQVSIIGTKSSQDQGPPADWAGLQTIAFPKMGPSTLHFAPRAGHWLRRSGLRPDVISLEGVWLHLFGKIAQWAKKQNVPYMITAHGNFNPVALNLSAWKKRIAQYWFASEMLKHASCFHAITEQEYRWIRDYGLRQPVCVVPNGVSIPPVNSAVQISTELRTRRAALFVGRLHHIKGLDLLLNAWAQVAASRPDWQLVIAGNNDGAQQELESLNESLGSRNVQFVGPLYGDAKSTFLSLCDFFVLPSRSEGLAMAPLEAMSFGKPVLLTKTCNFPEAAQFGAGVEVTCDVDALVEGLKRMMSMDDRERDVMGLAGKKLVEQHYNWQVICSELEQVYGWMAGKNSAPASIRFD